MTDLLVTPNAEGAYLALSRTKTGRLVRKEILRKGTLHYPGVAGGKVELTDDTFDNIVKNFDSKVCDIVQFPLADAKNAHTEDPLRNGGEVVKLEHKGDSLFAYIDVRNEQIAKAITDKTLLGASAMLSLDYTDTRTGQKAGPTLLHVAGTNRPHVTELADYELIAASVDSKDQVVVLTADNDNHEEGTGDMPKTIEELFEELKSEHNVDVPALQAKVAEGESVATLSAQITAALSKGDVIQLSNGESASAEDLVIAVGQLVEDRTELSNRVDTLELSARQAVAEAEVDKLVEGGFISEAQRDGFVKLRLSNEETFKELVPEKPILKLSGEAVGFVPADEQPEDVREAEIARLSAL